MRLPLAVPPTSLPSIGHWGFWETYKSIIIICQLYLLLSHLLSLTALQKKVSLFLERMLSARTFDRTVNLMHICI